MGIVVRSAIYRPRMAEALGHNVPLVFMSVFGVGAAMAGLAGAVAGAFHHQPQHGADWACWCSCGVPSAGWGSLEGAADRTLLIGRSVRSLGRYRHQSWPLSPACSARVNGPKAWAA